MANFPEFNEIRDLQAHLNDQQFADLTVIADDGRMYFQQIVDRIKDLTEIYQDQKIRAEMLADFAKLLIEKNFDFNNTIKDQLGFTPLGSLFKHINVSGQDGKLVKHIFRALLADQNIDWYQDSKLAAWSMLEGPVLLRVLTETTSGGILKRIKECSDNGIVIDFDRLVAQDPALGVAPQLAGHNMFNLIVHISNVCDLHGVKFSTKNLQDIVSALLKNNASHLEHFFGNIFNNAGNYNVLQLHNTLKVLTDNGVKIDLHHPSISLRNMLNKPYASSTDDIRHDMTTIKLLQSIQIDGSPLDNSTFFRADDNQFMPGNGAGVAPGIIGTNLFHHILSKVTNAFHDRIEHFQVAISELAAMSSDAEVQLYMNSPDANGTTGWNFLTACIQTPNTMYPQGQAPMHPTKIYKKAFKELLKLECIKKEQLTAIFMQYVPIDEVIETIHKKGIRLALNESFDIDQTLTSRNFANGNFQAQLQWFNSVIFGNGNKTSILDMLFSHWENNKFNIHNLEILQKLQIIDSSSGLSEHLYKAPAQAGIAQAGIALPAQHKVGLLDCININHSVESLTLAINALSEIGIELKMLESYIPLFTSIAKYPTAFGVVKQLSIFKNSDPKVIAKFVGNCEIDSIPYILQDLVNDGMQIDFTEDMPLLFSAIGLSYQMAPAIGGMHHNPKALPLHALNSVIKLLKSGNVTIDSDKALAGVSIFDYRDSGEALEILEILKENKDTIKSDLQNIAPHVWGILRGIAQEQENKVKLLGIIKAFESQDFDWSKFFVDVCHIAIDLSHVSNNWDFFLEHAPSLTPIQMAKGLLTKYDIKTALECVKQKVSQDLNSIRDDEGNTVWHFLAKNFLFQLHVPLIINHGAQFNVANNSGETAFITLLESECVIVRTLYDLLPTLIHQGVDLNAKSPKGRFLLSKIASNQHDAPHIIEVIRRCLENCVKLNLNMLDGEVEGKGSRIIDYIADFYKKGIVKIDLIKQLRELGSVEPETPITQLDSIEYKVDISNNRLEEFGSNRLNAKKLIDHLCREYDLTDDQIDQIITEFKNRTDINIPVGNIDAYGIAWSENDPKVNTIPMVIDAITGTYQSPYSIGTAADLLLSRDASVWTNTPVKVNGKKLIGTMIHAINQRPDLEVYHQNTGHIQLIKLFTYILSNLHSCTPGKLVNLAAVIQEMITADDPEINYQDEKFNAQYYEIANKLFEMLKNEFKQETAKSVAIWALDMTSNRDRPELWNYNSQKIHGMMNQCIASLDTTTDASYHFTRIFMDRICNNDALGKGLAYQVNPQTDLALPTEIHKGWQVAAIEGFSLIAQDFCNQLASHAQSNSDLSEFFRNVAIDIKFAFANFSCVRPEIFLNTIRQMPHEKQAEAVVLIIDNIELSNHAIMLLSENLLDQIHSNPEGVKTAIEDNDTALNFMDYFDPNNALKILINFAREYQVDCIFGYLGQYIRKELVDELSQEIFTEQAISQHLVEGLFDEIIAEVREELAEEELAMAGELLDNNDEA